MVLACVAAPAQAAFPGANGKLAFMSVRDGDAEIYAANADGSNVVQLTTNPAGDSDPAWSPDGRKLVFDSTRDGDYEIYSMSADGSGQTDVSNDHASSDYDPAWSPDAAQIVFVGERNNSADVYVMNWDGTGRINLTNTPTVNEGSPSWSPDGSKIAFSSSASGQGDIYSMNPDGTDVTNLSDLPGDDRNPTWSPDGANIAFESFNTGFQEIWKMNADGTSRRRVTDNQSQSVAPAWSPDAANAKIAFTQHCVGTGCNAEIYVMNVDGSSPVNVTNNPAVDGAADWQPVLSGYARPRGASPLYVSLVPAFQPCSTPNRVHAPPLAFGSCASPAQTSGSLTVGTPDSNGVTANSTGSARFTTIVGDPATPANEADVGIRVNVTDVRHRPDLADYTGELDLHLGIRITDRANMPAPLGPGPGTVADAVLAATVPCAASVDITAGSTCGLSSSVNALSPGTVQEGRRSVWQTTSVQLYDGGPDGVTSTRADNTVFEVPGLFAP
jgi:dipeptidyl aminopeptidase/acylaminoacyl peptidase